MVLVDSVPDGNGSLWATWEPDNGTELRVGAGVRYVGKSENNVVRYETSSYTLGDLWWAEINDNLDFALNIPNDRQRIFNFLSDSW